MLRAVAVRIDLLLTICCLLGTRRPNCPSATISTVISRGVCDKPFWSSISELTESSACKRTVTSKLKKGDRVVHTRSPSLPCGRVVQVASRLSSLFCSQSSTSSSTHPTLLGPSCTRFGNWPTFSSRAMCCGEYKTNSFSWRFESILITMSPRMKSIAMPRLTTIPRSTQFSGAEHPLSSDA